MRCWRRRASRGAATLFRPEHYAHFHTLKRLRAPRTTVSLAWMVAVGLGVTIVILFTVPWVQTAAGSGQVVALNPNDRVQSITALVPGRVDRWFVSDGQQVRAGEPIARIVDNDPQLLNRLADERTQVLAEIEAARGSITAVQNSIAVAGLDVDRSRELLSAGLIARRDYELSQIKVADGRTKLAEARAKLADSRGKLNRIDVSLGRQSAQVVTAPRDGLIQQIAQSSGGTLVAAGAVLATLTPEAAGRVVELLIDGRDIALIHPGQHVRLEFEGWPAIQISGWPTAATGLFEGQVRSVDPSAQPNGLFRVLVEEAPGAAPWPGPAYIRLGAKGRGWVQMGTVKVGYELWRQLNDFPLEFRRPADEQAAAKKGADEAATKK